MFTSEYEEKGFAGLGFKQGYRWVAKVREGLLRGFPVIGDALKISLSCRRSLEGH